MQQTVGAATGAGSEGVTGAATPAAPGTSRLSVAAEFRRGWPIVLAAAVGLACGLGALPIYSLGALTKPMVDDLGWSRAEVQAARTGTGRTDDPDLTLLHARILIARKQPGQALQLLGTLLERMPDHSSTARCV